MTASTKNLTIGSIAAIGIGVLVYMITKNTAAATAATKKLGVPAAGTTKATTAKTTAAQTNNSSVVTAVSSGVSSLANTIAKAFSPSSTPTTPTAPTPTTASTSNSEYDSIMSQIDADILGQSGTPSTPMVLAPTDTTQATSSLSPFSTDNWNNSISGTPATTATPTPDVPIVDNPPMVLAPTADTTAYIPDTSLLVNTDSFDGVFRRGLWN